MSPTPKSLRERLLAKVEIDQESGCWLWTATISEHGYARVYEGGSHGRTLSAHRVAYELFVGEIPEGLTLDHLCRVRHCVNPDHLEPVTMRENLMRGDTPAARNAAKTHCKRGHRLTEENFYRTADGGRACKTCIRDRMRVRMREVRRRAREAVA